MPEDEATQEIMQLGESILRLASKHKIMFCGFAFRKDPPFMMNLSNCTKDASRVPETYRAIADILEEKERSNLVRKVNLTEPN